MPYAGKTLMGRQHVSLVAPHWPHEKVKATATAMAESNLSIGAWHDNLDGDGEIDTRDCGLYQINIPGRHVGTPTEARLRTDSKEEAVFMEVARNNIEAAYDLWTQPWIRNQQRDFRRWQPWVAYTSGWAMFTEAWVWKQTDGEPVGPWTQTGRYLHKAIRAVANWHYLVAKDMSGPQAVREANRLAKFYGVKDTSFYWHNRSFVTAKYPPAPAAPPVDGVGPRPKKNDGK